MKFRSFKSKGGIIQLLWVVCVLLAVFRSYFHLKSSAETAAFAAAIAIGLFIFPLSGLLGDAVLGRYRLIKCSLHALWVSIIIHSLADVLVHIYQVNGSRTWSIVSDSFLYLWGAGCGLFLINSVQFGIDQLVDATSRQISSYISWYCWCFFMTDVIEILVLECTYYPWWNTIRSGFLAFVITIALCLDLLVNKDLVKEPTSPNPLKLIFKVLHYAAKNKYPRLRSAFSYWDERKSRLELSKTKYGGPFMSEEVEDVKTFLRMVGIICVAGFFAGYFLVFANVKNFMFFHFQDVDYKEHTEDKSDTPHCLVRNILHRASSFLIVVGVPVFEYFLYPLLWKYESSITIFKRFITGMCFLFISQLNYLALEVAGNLLDSNKNITLPCLFNASKKDLINGNTFSISFYWLGIPEISSAVAYYLIFTSGMEFLCAQSPYSMKGLLMGLAYSSVAFFILVHFGLRYAYQNLNTQDKSCGTWYFLVSCALTGVLIVAICIIFNWYSKRRRRDNTDDASTESCDLPYSSQNALI